MHSSEIFAAGKTVLVQNYPNPAFSTTTIDFRLPEKKDVKLKVNDNSGRLVAVLANESFDAGYHKIIFDTSRLAPDVYFYSLITDNFKEIKKLIIAK